MKLLPSSADPVAMRAPDPARPMFFLHIPRTGGFTLKTLLERVYGARHTLVDLHKYDHTVIDPADYDLLEGHVGFKKSRLLAGAPNLYTLVRDPVGRTVSVARHLRRYGRQERHRALKSRNVKLEDLFAEVPDLSNGQTKQLSDRLPERTAVPEHLAKATTVLDAIAFGLTDSYDTSVTLMAERFGFHVPRFGVSNASAARGDRDLRSKKFRELVLEHNQLDQQLYEHARTVFAARVDGYVEALRSLSLESGSATGNLLLDSSAAWDEITLPRGATKVELEGWMLLDGGPADAVLADAGAGWVPLLARQHSRDASWSTRSAANIYAGLSGAVPIGPGATTLTIEGFDRTRGVRASRSIPIRMQ